MATNTMFGGPVRAVYDGSGNVVGLSAGGKQIEYLRTVTTGARNLAATFTGYMFFAPFVLDVPTKLNRVAGLCEVTEVLKGMEIALYSESLVRIATTGWQAVPVVGPFEYAHAEVLLEPGTYFYGFITDSTTAQFAATYCLNKGVRAVYTAPMPVDFSTTTTSIGTVPALTGLSKYLDVPTLFEDVSDLSGRYRVLGVGTSSQPWGVDITTSKIIWSDNSGITWTQMMDAPMISNGMIDLIWCTTFIVVLCNDCTIWKSSDLTSGATWEEITVPISAGMRRDTAITRPYAIAWFDNYICWGEYSSGDTLQNHPTDPDGPRLFKYGPMSGTPEWAVSKTFTARHMHSLYVQGVGLMLITLGDGDLADVGVWRCTNIAADTYSQRQNLSYSRQYPVDLITVTGYGILAASDEPGTFVQSMLSHTTAGHSVLARQILQPGYNDNSFNQYDDVTNLRGETARSIVLDSKYKNIYFWSAEGPESWLYVSPPPYNQCHQLAKLDVAMHGRSVTSGGRLLMWDKAYAVAKFPWQK